MKRRILMSVVLVFFLTAAGAYAQSLGGSETMFVSVDPLGLLTVGPSLEIGGVLPGGLQIGGRFRLPALGVLIQVLSKSNTLYPEEQWVMPWSVGADVVVTGRSMFNDRHGLYYGGSLGVQFTDTRNYWYDTYSPYYRKYITWHVPVMGIFGYELDPDTKMYFRFGILAGIAVGITEKEYIPTASGVTTDSYSPYTYFIGAAQTIIGWRM